MQRSKLVYKLNLDYGIVIPVFGFSSMSYSYEADQAIISGLYFIFSLVFIFSYMWCWVSLGYWFVICTHYFQSSPLSLILITIVIECQILKHFCFGLNFLKFWVNLSCLFFTYVGNFIRLNKGAPNLLVPLQSQWGLFSVATLNMMHANLSLSVSSASMGRWTGLTWRQVTF